MTPPPTDVTSPPAARAWSWVHHLRAGGITPWSRWSGTEETRPTPLGDRRVAVLPGAQQLELLRRMNLRVAELGLPPFPGDVADRVLTAALTGRGQDELPLAGGLSARYGPPPVDPEEVGSDELLRVGLGVVADDLTTGEPQQERPRRTRWRRQTYRLVGDPWLADPARAGLIRDGRPPGGGDAIVFVLGTDLGTMCVHAWLAGAFGPGIHPWRAFWRRLRDERRPALRADLLRAADTWAGRVGPERVKVVLDPALLPAPLGVDRLETAAVPTHTAAELTRRLVAVVGMRADRRRRAELLGAPWRERLEAVTPTDAPRLAVPAEHTEWVADLAREVREELLRRDYAVWGDPDLLVPPPVAQHPDPPGPDSDGMLELAIDLVVRRPERE